MRYPFTNENPLPGSSTLPSSCAKPYRLGKTTPTFRRDSVPLPCIELDGEGQGHQAQAEEYHGATKPHTPPPPPSNPHPLGPPWRSRMIVPHILASVQRLSLAGGLAWCEAPLATPLARSFLRARGAKKPFRQFAVVWEGITPHRIHLTGRQTQLQSRRREAPSQDSLHFRISNFKITLKFYIVRTAWRG